MSNPDQVPDRDDLTIPVEPRSSTSSATSTISIGGDVGGHVVTGNDNTLAPANTNTAWWNAGIVQTILGWLLRRK